MQSLVPPLFGANTARGILCFALTCWSCSILPGWHKRCLRPRKLGCT